MSKDDDDLKELDLILEKVNQHKSSCLEAVSPYITMGLALPATVLDQLSAEGTALREALSQAQERTHDPHLKASYVHFIQELDADLAALKNSE